MKLSGEPVRSIAAVSGSDGRVLAVRVLDQTRLPHAVVWLELSAPETVEQAIASMQVRGAPLIGAAGAFGLALALARDAGDRSLEHWAARLAATRPTAVNLRWAVERVQRVVQTKPPAERPAAAGREAQAIADEDVAINAAIGAQGLALLERLAQTHGRGRAERPLEIMTHCNAGWLATVDWGTALAPIYRAHDAGLAVHVWVSETRPRNQGALTAFELTEHGVPCTVIADNAAGVLMAEGRVDAVIVGCDRVAANGDTANKVGTYLKALAARAHGVPFWVALPSPTFDASLASGAAIPIERRAASEVLEIGGRASGDGVALVSPFPAGAEADNPAFDVTPAALISAWMTERGVYTTPEALRGGLTR
jgi:methylthioribose-1-phosphate isomerase